MKRLAIAIIAALPFCSAQAVERYEVRNNSGQRVFKLNFYTPTNDGYFTDEGVPQRRTIKETGSGTLPMQIKGRYADSLQSTLGVEALFQRTEALSATLRLGWT